MKNTNQCPKCGGTDILRIPGTVGSYGSGNNIAAGFFSGRIKVTRFLCSGCGFSEEWIESPEDIEKLRARYTPDET